MARLSLVAILAIARLLTSFAVDAQDVTCAEKKEDVAALLQGPVAVQRLAGDLPTLVETMEDDEAEDAANILGNPSSKKKKGSKKKRKKAPKKDSNTKKAPPTTAPTQSSPVAPASTCSSYKTRDSCTAHNCGFYSQLGQRTKADTKGTCQVCGSLLSPQTCKARYGCHWENACKPYVDIILGGAKHENFGNRMARPENVHTQVCDNNDVCRKCDDKRQCWYGCGTKCDTTSKNGLQVHVPPNSPGNRVVSFWAKCAPDSVFYVVARGTVNGAVDVLFDNVVVKAGMQGKSREVEKGTKKRKKGTEVQQDQATIKPGKSGSQHIKIIFRVADITKFASATISLMGVKLDPYVDRCMGRKYCLKALGEGTGPAFELRNSNERQLACAQGKELPGPSKAMCSKWKACLKTHGHSLEEVVEVLSAAVAPGVVDGKGQSLVVVEQQDSKGCIDPGIADPEAFECECLDGLKKTCKDSPDLEKCFVKLMCAHKAICATWKRVKCQASMISEDDGDLIPASATTNNEGIGSLLIQRSESAENNTAGMEQLTQVSTNVADNDGLGDGLDGTMQGKCAAQ